MEKLFTEVEFEGTAPNWATGLGNRFTDDFGRIWHTSCTLDPKHWGEPINRKEYQETNQKMMRLLGKIDIPEKE